MSDPAQMPVFVHCEHGADRTGVLCAMYRIAIEDWSPEDAAAEMTRNGMGFNSLFGNLVERVRTADAASLRRQAGLSEQPSVARAD